MAKKAKRVRVPKEKQTYIAGTEPPKIKAIEDAAVRYVQFRDERMDAGEQEVKLKAKLIAVMKEHDLTTYNFDGFMVELGHTDEDTVKVKKKRAAKE
jgi:hypothetical protein